MHFAPIAERESPEEQALTLTGSLESELLQPSTLQPEKWMLGPMAGRSPAMQQVFARMRYTAPHFRLASVEGESGTGKMLAAQTLHRIGPGAAGPFAPHLAAAFLDGPEARWSEVRGGLLYLSRVDELSAEQQRRLRDFLDRSAHERLRIHSASGPLQLVAGSAQPLRHLASLGTFRSDLANHLNAIRFLLPPLRDRREDIPLLASLFLRNWSLEHNKPLRGFAPGAFSRLIPHNWPGNVRELESAIATAALECSGQWIRPIDVPCLDWPLSGSQTHDLAADDPNLDQAILRHIVRILARANGNKVRAARMLGISRSTLYRLLDPANPASLGHDSLRA
ncbi:MAG TPA: sigma 54-interacting transcriptional regulator [Acidobacteriaceae bacterium]|nr:sigma 54-interacting transcriptional regulator [Acidobacteriaceae bacterium]